VIGYTGCWIGVVSDGLMIDVVNLTKRYAGHTAVSNISFSVGHGEIVGLLGPNGAGKSTTMRILACYLPATSGTVQVAGLDVFKRSDEVRRRIGYMPENNPLHLDLRVREYLRFRARLKGLGWKASRRRVDRVMEQCGLTEVSRRIIGQLSKGYRRRVGLADALVAEPEVIILDEPTIGLDSNQSREVSSNSHFAPRSGLASGSAVNDQRPGRHWVRYRGSAALWAPR
jgi:ABC-2 type transport system ATP-binding protein